MRVLGLFSNDQHKKTRIGKMVTVLKIYKLVYIKSNHKGEIQQNIEKQKEGTRRKDHDE